MVSITGLAAFMRLYALDHIPPGFHGDEGLTGLDAQRILKEGWIGPYIGSALGMLTGPLYWAAIVLKLLGPTGFAVRFSMALLGIVTIPLLYLVFRPMFGRSCALLAAALLALSAWHLHYSRTGFPMISWPLMEVIALGLLFAALESKRWPLFALAGLALGLGAYTYNAYPLFALAIGLFLVWLLLRGHPMGRSQLLLRLGVTLVVSLLVALPLLAYVLDPSNDFFSHHRLVSLFASKRYQGAGTMEQATIVLSQAAALLKAMTISPRPDFIDGTGLYPMLDPITLVLLLVGIVLFVTRWRSPPHLLMLLLLGALPLGGIVTSEMGGMFRRTLGLVPVIAVIAAAPLAYLWDEATGWRPGQRVAARSAVLLLVAGAGFLNLQRYFGDFADSGLARWVYAQEIAEASRYLASLPEGPYVYFYSGRWSFHYETRRYLAPQAKGEDRSREFGTFSLEADRSRDLLFLFLPPYQELAGEVGARYPGGSVFEKKGADGTLFVAYSLAKDASAAGADRP